ncbi:copper chaperone PCu(A)C [Simplicispira psychrophila]|uniref:copper chaperone PCu(A)C n=1 Tax=Simplicispira psychrophila TaxID=80882 RepID=UPI000482951A|nr:copper chaperone PCu(A)C [Simplicispira psychrophila]
MTLQRLISPVFLAVALLAGTAQAQTPAPAPAPASATAAVAVEGAWVRASVPGQKATGAFMRLTAPETMRLVRTQSPAAAVTEVHEMKMDGDVMKMRAVPVLELPAGKAVDLKPGGYHVMLMDLKAPLAKGSSVPVTLFFQDAKGVESQQQLHLPVATQAPGSTGAPAMPMQHNQH